MFNTHVLIINIWIYFHEQESLCSDAASFDLPPGLLSACISEVTTCINIAVARRKSNDKSCDPDTFAILRGKIIVNMTNLIILNLCDFLPLYIYSSSFEA